MKCQKILLFSFLCSFFASKAETACDASYVDLHNKLHNVSELIFILSDYDKSEESPIRALKRFIEDGHAACERDEVLQVLEYADWLLHNMGEEIDAVQRKKLSRAIDNAADVILADILTAEDTNIDTKQTRSSVADLNVGGNISMNDSTTDKIGNIIKNGVRFIHNYPSGGHNNTFVGKRAGNFTTLTGTANSGFGTQALRRLETGKRNTAVGKDALTTNRTGSDNTAIGMNTLMSNRISGNNTAVGSGAMSSYLEGILLGNNTAIGKDALFSLQFGDSNTAVGASAGKNFVSGPTGANNIFLGFEAGVLLTEGSSNIYIGSHGGDDPHESVTVRIGSDIQRKCVIPSVSVAITNGNPVSIDGVTGQLGIKLSTRKVKSNIKTMTDESYKIFDLNPVLFTYKTDETDTIQYGLIAEEVDEVFPALVAYDQDGSAYTVRYEMLPVLLLNEMKKQKQEIMELKELVACLHAQVKRFVTG